jgi:hypothetical protein
LHVFAITFPKTLLVECISFMINGLIHPWMDMMNTWMTSKWMNAIHSFLYRICLHNLYVLW